MYAEKLPASWIVRATLDDTSVYKDGNCTTNYECDMWLCGVADRIGVQRTGWGGLMIYVNGRSLGTAALNVPGKVYAVVDVYGKCKQVTLVNSAKGQTYVPVYVGL